MSGFAHPTDEGNTRTVVANDHQALVISAVATAISSDAGKHCRDQVRLLPSVSHPLPFAIPLFLYRSFFAPEECFSHRATNQKMACIATRINQNSEWNSRSPFSFPQ